MTQFKVKPTRCNISSWEEIERILDELHNETSRVRSSISFKIKSREQIDWNLSKIISKIEKQNYDAQKIISSLSKSMDIYRKTESEILNKNNGVIDNSKTNKTQNNFNESEFILTIEEIFDDLLNIQNISSIILNPFLGSLLITNSISKHPEWIDFIFGDTELEGSLFGGSVENKDTVLGIDTSGKAEWALLGFNSKKETSIDFDLEEEANIGLNANLGLEGYLAQFGVEDKYGLLRNSATVGVGVASIGAGMGCVLFEDGKLDPNINVGANAEVKGITGEIKSQFGNEDYNIHSTASGAVGSATAEVQGVISLDEISAKAEVGAAVLEGEVETGFKIFGVNFDLTTSGEFMAVGAGAEFKVETSSIELGGKLSALAGLGLNLKISW